jgi:hypothetical protein
MNRDEFKAAWDASPHPLRMVVTKKNRAEIWAHSYSIAPSKYEFDDGTVDCYEELTLCQVRVGSPHIVANIHLEDVEVVR